MRIWCCGIESVMGERGSIPGSWWDARRMVAIVFE